MSDEIESNVDPTEQMVKQQERARESAEREENERDADYGGEERTEAFDVADAIESL